MRKSLVIVFVLCCFGFSIAQRPSDEYALVKPKQILKVSRLGTRDAAIICTDASDPTGYKRGDVLIISCGRADSK